MARYSTRSRTNPKVGSINPTLFQYPDNDKDLEPGKSVITFTRHDQLQLQTPRFFNDTIITFFMQYYLDTRISPEVSQRTHIFDSFFFQKLKSIREKKQTTLTSYNLASKWLNGVRIFEKDFLIMPVCEKDHWLLIIVCYPFNEPTKRNHLTPDEELYEPVVLVLNSCTGLAPSIKKALQRFLEYQWLKERGTERFFSIHNAKSSGIRLLFPDLPQQKNNFDCGVYVINYFYCFLREPRKAYVKMFRKHSMRSWFKDNKVDTSWERRRMTQIVKEMISKWREQHKSNPINNNNYEIRNLQQYSSQGEEQEREEGEEEIDDDDDRGSTSCQVIDLSEDNEPTVNGNKEGSIIVIHI